ncbi:MarR family winged helix-turn-helix transcriptional regulator [Streptomyces sp. NPDC088387]|uniref:MarR family winged helix-turn-helix transcriptional regulator n=1 Tax=Streptomyces sp. NPDC088387 TaxID=3365859 RepID=UPI0038064EE2
MDANPAPPQQRPPDATRELVELLEVLWEHGKDMVSTAPVSASQLRVLYVLDRIQGANLRTLGEALGAAAPSVSRMCDRLEALGFLQRVQSPARRREVELHLTRQGQAHLRQLRESRREELVSAISAMTPSARKALFTGLSSFRDAMEEVGPSPWPRPVQSEARSA